MATFYPPTDTNRTSLTILWNRARDSVAASYGYQLDRSPADLRYLQRLIDDMRETDVDDELWLALGIAFGRVLQGRIPQLQWWVVEDEYGRDLVLRYEETSIRLNVIYMVQKRIARGERPDLAEMYDGTQDAIANILAKGQD